MGNVIKMILSAVGFLFAAVLIFVMVSYFNRGKSVTTKNADSALALLENAETGSVDIEEYDGETVQGSVVISIIESLPTNSNSVKVLVYTSGGSVVSEYTNAGTTNESNINLTASPYNVATEAPKSTGVTKATGNYKIKTDATYINPTQNYLVECRYTPNEALAYVAITHKTSNN